MRGRSYNLENECTRVALTEDIDISSFTCGDNELDEFFRNESRDYEREMLARSYAFITDDARSQPVAVFSVSNSSISMTALSSTVRNRMQRKIPNVKRRKSYPALLIGRLGVDVRYHGKGIGSQVLDYIKYWFTHPRYESICRYLVVDAVNEKDVLRFYERNGFKTLYATEDEELSALGKDGEELRSRVMFCDLKQWLLSRVDGK